MPAYCRSFLFCEISLICCIYQICMKPAFTTRSYSPLAPNYKHNAVLHLVIFCAVCFILLHMVSVILTVISSEPKLVFGTKVLPAVALQSSDTFVHRPWVLLTYFLGHESFWNLLSNMLWLYCFGSVIQSLVGHREIIPLFILSGLVSGAVYLIFTFSWPQMPGRNMLLLTAQPGIIAFAIAAITLAPKYKYYLGERMAIPLWLLICVYIMLSCLSLINNQVSVLVLLGAAALSGFGYIKLLQSGYKPGAWLYRIGNRVGSIFTPKDEQPWPNRVKEQNRQAIKMKKEQYSEEYIDSILDKINQKGYGALSAEEKDALMKASKESES